ncbi:MAG: class I SAM-dependent methyltransferase [Patescibacteria group bacterium]|jgi:ubiquinone/menaquinone biosynthesis C-methylase UbiE
MPTNYEIENWYNKRHQTMGDKSWRPFRAYRVFLDYLQAQPGGKLLDIGCGTGYLLRHAQERGLLTYGIDISIDGTKLAKKNSPYSEINISNGEQVPYPDNYFDYITCIGVLEHFLDIHKGIDEMRRVARPRGKFCIVVPNKNFILWKFRQNKGTHQQDINEQLFDLDGWSRQFLRAGLTINQVLPDKWKLRGVYLPLRYTYQFVFILEK